MGRSDNGQTECLQGHAAVVTGNEINQKKITLYFALSLKILAIFSHTHCCISFEFFFFLVGDREIGVLQTHWSADKPHESLSKCTLLRWRTIYITRRKKNISDTQGRFLLQLVTVTIKQNEEEKREPLSAFFAHFIQQWKWQCRQLVGRYVTRWPAWRCLESARQLQARLSLAALHLCSSHSLGTQIILYRDNG